MELKELQKEYMKLEKKYKLPTFQELNENFEIGKLDRDTGEMLRAVRKMMMEKIVNSMGFLEMMLNPMQAPRMYHTYIKNMSVEDRKRIDRIYAVLASVSVMSLEREIDYDEKKEAELIKDVLKIWGEVKGDFRKILGNINNPVENNFKKERSYFG